MIKELVAGIAVGFFLTTIPFVFQLLRQNREIRKRHDMSMAILKVTQEWLRK